jgi:phenylalanyl-tRNA synthetase beta subunit
LSYSFISDKDVEIFNLDENKLLRIKNPLSAEFSFFRPNLLINVLKQVAKNPFFPEIRMFEIGRIHFDGIEEEEIIILINSNNRKELEDIKATFEKLGLNLEFSEVPQKIREIFKIKKNIFYLIGRLSYPRKGFFEFNDLTVKSCKVPSEFPPVQIDLAFIVEKDLSPKLIEKEFYSHPNVILVELFDEFASDKFGKDKKNVAYHLWLGDERGPLRDSKVKIIIEEIVRKIGQKFKAKLRDF